MKDKFIEILESHGFNKSEFNDVFEAMSEILEASADNTEEKEPHATNSIRKYREVAIDINDFDYFCENQSE